MKTFIQNIYALLIRVLLVLLFGVAIALILMIPESNSFMILLGSKVLGLGLLVISYNGLLSLGVIQYLSKL